ncbi:hypothetical protein [Bradyrhizobium sacchari]|uniref:hypothetical protein n=1 Tax=Bradyrhizobium sacchari TaxID=1399419 RepID=UPI0010A97286|nr:hypothetical protein [Bradyrhizobium sacchari]
MLSRRQVLGAGAGLASCLLPARADTVQRKLEAKWIADLTVASAGGTSIEVSALPHVMSEDFWRFTVLAVVKDFATMLRLNNPWYFYSLAIDDRVRPTYAAVDGRVLGVDTPHQGVLLIGDTMTRSLITLFRERSNGAAIAGSLAHELAHFYQFKNGPEANSTWWLSLLRDDGNITRRKAELHADFLAGWCLGQWSEKFMDYVGIDIVAKRLYSFGTMDDLDPNSHGTPEQRYAVTLRGYFLGKNETADAVQAAEQGRLFVNAIVPMRAEQ